MDNTYKFTGKVNPGKALITFILALPIAFISGVAYAFLADLIPFIIIDLVIFVVTVVLGLMCAIMLFVRYGAVRNKTVHFIAAMILALVGWYANWALTVNQHGFFRHLTDVSGNLSEIVDYLNTHVIAISKGSIGGIEISGIGMWTIGIIETLLILIIPVVLSFVYSKNYYCESCQKFNKDREFYLMGDGEEALLMKGKDTGDFTGIKAFVQSAAVPDSDNGIDLKKPVYHVEASYCPSCGQNGVINIQTGYFEKDEKKGTLSFNGLEFIAEHTMMDDQSIKIIFGS